MLTLRAFRGAIPAMVAMLSVIACGGGNGSGSTATPTLPTGPSTTYPAARVYALMDPGETSQTMTTFAAKSTVDGLAYRTRWSDLETAPGTYNWSTLDAAFDVVRAQSKHLTVHIGVSGGAWPSWLTPVGITTYTYSAPTGGQVTDPLPWDVLFLSSYTNFVAALDAHIQSRGDTSLLNAVSVGAPVGEMSLVGCQNNLLGSVTYSRANYLTAWTTAIGSYANRFGTASIFVSAPIATICRPDNDGRAFYLAVMTAVASNSHLAIFAADLNAQGSSRIGQVDSSLAQLRINFQTIWSATNDPSNRMAGTLQSAVCRGLQIGAGYLEIYKSDLTSTDAAIVSAIDTARTGKGCP